MEYCVRKYFRLVPSARYKHIISKYRQSLELEDKNSAPDYRTGEVPVVTKHHGLECRRQGDCFNVVTDAD